MAVGGCQFNVAKRPGYETSPVCRIIRHALPSEVVTSRNPVSKARTELRQGVIVELVPWSAIELRGLVAVGAAYRHKRPRPPQGRGRQLIVVAREEPVPGRPGEGERGSQKTRDRVRCMDKAQVVELGIRVGLLEEVPVSLHVNIRMWLDGLSWVRATETRWGGPAGWPFSVTGRHHSNPRCRRLQGFRANDGLYPKLFKRLYTSTTAKVYTLGRQGRQSTRHKARCHKVNVKTRY